jgi:hypothetical protein
MSDQEQVYSRYLIVRAHGLFWNGDPSKSGSRFREFFITSDDWSSMAGTFQVFGIEGTSNRLQDGFLVISDDSKNLIFDGDFAGLEAAEVKYKQLVAEAIKEGFIKTSKI